MLKTIRILLPIFPNDAKETYFKGCISVLEDNSITIHIIQFTTSNELLHEIPRKWNNILYGYCGNFISNKIYSKFKNFLLLEQNSTVFINKLIINGNEVSTTSNCILMLYNYDSIKNSQAINKSTDDYFSTLVNLIQDGHNVPNSTQIKKSSKNPEWLASSMFLQHIYNYWKLINWLISSFRREKKISVKKGNLFTAIIMDIILGYLMLQLLSHDKNDIIMVLMGFLEKLINSLTSILKWLMGAPVGLKLNNAFNKMLGKYFSYHVQLWWLFLDVSGAKLHVILHIYRFIGYLGITYQIAMISDLICIATFHSYCIYVYAARLFNIQISGLIALLRLFVGRKYNPLRGGIDSCEYTNQELFVGTVAFTILLLLMPTTALYYIVFTMFRVLSLVIQYLLAKSIYIIQTLPLYVVSLWITQSPKVTGNILIEVISQEDNAPLILRIKLFSKSIPELVKKFRPPVEVPKQVDWTNLVSNVLIGKQII